MRPTALVSGDAGFVGSHFARRLKADGWDIEGCDIKRGMLEDCRDVFAGSTRFDLVVHCAAVVGGRATIEGQPMAVASDLAIDSDLWQWALRTKPGRVVYFSSSAAYPIAYQTTDMPLVLKDPRLSEDDIKIDSIYQPDETYGLAKLVGEIQAELVRAEGIPVSVVRPFSGYGEDQSTDYPFPAFIDRAARQADPFSVWGDGLQVRDFIHIDDIVDAVMVMVDEGIDGPVNLCTGRPTSFNQLAEMCCWQAGYTPSIAHRTDAPTGVRYRVGDPTLMSTFYTPKVELEDGIGRALAARMEA